MSRDLYIKANASTSASASTNEWQRPADWLPMPINITSSDQIFVGLHAVIENSDNYCSFSFTTSAGQYRVDWGDGNVTLHNSGTIAQYQYNYANISNSTLSSRGYKQVIVKVTPVSGNLLTCNFQQRFVTTPVQNQAYSSGFLECILSMPNASSGQSITFGGTTVRHAYCEKVEIKTIGNATNMTSMFQNCFSLQSVPLFNTINVTNMTSMFYNCFSLQSVPLFNTTNVTNMTSMFSSCNSLQSVPLFNTTNVTNMTNMFYNCYSLNSIPAFTTTAVTTDFTTFANGCNSLNRITMSFNRTVALQNCQLSKDALVEIFTNLVNRTATTSAKIDITGNWGSSALTAADRLIATNKNWTIVG
jgi:surface protein